MKKLFVVPLALSAALAIADHKDGQPAEPQVLKGEVVALTLYLTEEMHGAEGATEALAALRGGSPAGLLAADGTVTLILVTSQEGGEALKYVAHNVEITGTIHEHGGMRAIVPKSVVDLGAVETKPVGGHEHK
ncbi:MAG: hypothetical protein HYY18_14465 [Planctomycetes bacterium]|nr:hypothetical protein [Planctomycetota bacterium]